MKDKKYNKEEFLTNLNKKKSKLKVEDTHTRATYLIENDILKKINALSEKKEKGFKTEFVNFALMKMLHEWNENDTFAISENETLLSRLDKYVVDSENQEQMEKLEHILQVVFEKKD
ncbi:hypothetical protein [Chengkuizengella sediminis]|uniref:hypothetical protein n=1 Tax=Chengkuizengella sediminis TaxID=1885917 RepID=UPI001389D772|nr:hypothetical protein [Chengkuizengella sediminis]NDI36615.1 hypothetical protein [Chengkuizengella sediminis]